MKRNSKDASHKKAGPKNSVLLVAALAGVLAVASGANASGVPVVDGLHTGVSKFAWIEQYRQKYEEMQKQIDQYRTQLKELENQLVGGSGFRGEIGYREALAKRNEDAFITERCGNGRGLKLGPSQLKEIVDAQYVNCVNIVRIENRKYNAVVRYLDTLSKRDAQLESLKKEATDVPEDKKGRLDRVMANLDQLAQYRVSDEKSSDTLMEGYDQMLKALNAEQVWLAKAAFAARDRGIVGDLVQYGALKGALQVARSRDR